MLNVRGRLRIYHRYRSLYGGGGGGHRLSPRAAAVLFHLINSCDQLSTMATGKHRFEPRAATVVPLEAAAFEEGAGGVAVLGAPERFLDPFISEERCVAH